MASRLLGGEVAGPDQVGHQTVVLSHLDEHPAGVVVDPAVPNVDYG